MDNHLFFHQNNRKHFFRTILYHRRASASTPNAKFFLFFTHIREKRIERFCSMNVKYHRTFFALLEN